jgi:hypothetical protein
VDGAVVQKEAHDTTRTEGMGANFKVTESKDFEVAANVAGEMDLFEQELVGDGMTVMVLVMVMVEPAR